MGKVQNLIDRIVAHYASIYSGANTPIVGGLAVNETIAVPVGSFPIGVHDFHPKGIEVCVFQYGNYKNHPLGYKLQEIVPNRIVRTVKKHPYSFGIGIIMGEDDIFYSDLRVYEGKKLRLTGFSDSWGNGESAYDILYKLGSPSHFFPYLLIDRDLQPESQIRQFLNDYDKARKRVKDQNDLG